MKSSSRIVAVGAALAFSAGTAGMAYAQATNPCAAKPANPCAPKNPCAAGKADIDRKLIVRPKGTKLAAGDTAALVKRGEALFKDTKLSSNGASCQSCHANNAFFQPTFSQAYPHPVAMAKERAGLAKIDLDEMIQLCMVIPMEAKPLPWGSAELAALVAYNRELQKAYRRKPPQGQSTNPCAPKANPCAPRKK